jgi:predicted small secreted protein
VINYKINKLKNLSVTILLVVVLSVSFSGCAIFRAMGETVEAFGEGAGTALVGVSSGTGHIISGTGRAISRAAGGTASAFEGDDFQSTPPPPTEEELRF